MVGDVLLIVSDKDKTFEQYHIVLQEGNEDFNVTMCGVEVVVEDPDYYINYDNGPIDADRLCWQCCEQFGRVYRQHHEARHAH